MNSTLHFIALWFIVSVIVTPFIAGWLASHVHVRHDKS
jgi:hypothetical protein